MFHRRTSAAIAVAAALTTLAVPLTANTAVAAPAAPASGADLVLPDPGQADGIAQIIHATTSAGFVSGLESGALKFIPFEGEARPFDRKGTPAVYGTGTDSIALWDSGASTMVLRDGPTGSEESYTLPKDLQIKAVVGRTVLATAYGQEGRETVRAITLQPGGLMDDRTVTTVGRGYDNWVGSNAHGALVRYRADSNSPLEEMWIDVAGGGKVVPVAAEDFALPNVQVSGDWIIRGDRKSGWKAYDTRKDAGTAAKTFSSPTATLYDGVAVLGEELVVRDADWLSAVSADGGPARRVVQADVSGAPQVSPDGRLIAFGPMQAGHGNDVFQLKADGAGKIQSAKFAVIPYRPVPIDFLAMENGRVQVSRVRDEGLPDYGIGRYTLGHTDPVVEARARETRQVGWYFDKNGRTEGETVATGDGGLAFHLATGGLKLFGPAMDSSMVGRARGLVPGTLQAGGRYLAAHVTGSTSPVVRVLPIAGWTSKDFPAPGGAFALSGTAMWRNTTTAGTVEALDHRTGAKLRADKVADCAVTEMQAVTSSLYWKCDGGRSGVYDTVAKTTFKLPAYNGTARLGQGFVAFTDGTALKVADVKGGTGVREIAKPLTTQVGKGWTVDRYTNRVAWVDDKLGIHVTPLVTPNPALSTYDTDVPATVDLATGARTWTPSWWMSKPAASWSMSLTSKATGKWVRTLWAGETRGAVRPVWDGKDSTGRELQNGSYTWTLKVKPADGQGAEYVRTGTVTVTGKAAFRDHTGDGQGDLFTLDTKGALALRPGGDSGVGWPVRSAEAWPTTSKLVPVGDLNDDRTNDFLVRDAAGVLRAYHATLGKPVTPSTPSKYIGPGWGQYDVLTSPGDLTGDGRADLIARQTTTGDVYFYAQDGLGGFKPRVKIMSNWKLYKQVFGAGDLNGDGAGDLLAVDGNGTMWRYDGLKTGTVKPRVQVGAANSAAGRRDFVGVGDISGDGKADLLSRNAAGELVRNLGQGNGTFAGPRVVTGGFGGYKNLL
ncbi:FG-GAP-like repeat-containing protein [Streptomyces sp. NPDC012888]|uniref:VCBS repeat-containing protein n=1 Tax=Streptomyces sp. NPDC012888 TaxID=3364855 RepID=UPI0036A9B4F5